VTDFSRRVYLLRERDLSPETIAVALAKTSRSPEPFDRNAAELSDARSAEFHEKWVVGYGHASVAEHAVLHIAVENVSRLAIECLESNRLVSFTEKSTRYQKWSSGAFLAPPEVIGGALEKPYRETCRQLLDTYARALETVGGLARTRFPRREGESDSRWEGRIRSCYVDVCRYLLPASVLANVGITINARALEHAVCKMLSHPLAEVRSIGVEIKQTALAEVPTLVKYAEENAYLRDLPEKFRRASAPLGLSPAPREDPPRSWMRLIDYEPGAEDRTLAAAGIRFCGWGLEESARRIRNASPEERRILADALLGGLGDHDQPLRELEHITYTFEAVMDQGAYFEVKRHRMMSQTPGPLGCDQGYITPRWFEEAGFLDEYNNAMGSAADEYRALHTTLGPDAAAYVVPNGYLRRMVLSMNLREAFHFCRLRSSEGAHAAVRVLALQAAEQIRLVHPLLGSILRWDGQPDWKDLEGDFFRTEGQD
jgi:thymidylate synthase ThyX